MKTKLILRLIVTSMVITSAYAQTIDDPLLDHYKAIETGTALNELANNYSPKTRIRVFGADFTGNGEKFIFITDNASYLGAHDKYEWSVYRPLKSGGYQLISSQDNYITAGPDGPNYIGYISEIKKYGIVYVGRHELTAYYLENGVLKMKEIEQTGEYPEINYISSTPNWNIQTYTLAQLAQKYPSVTASNNSKSASQ